MVIADQHPREGCRNSDPPLGHQHESNRACVELECRPALGGIVLLSFCYALPRRLVEFVVLHRRSKNFKELEIVVLRHETRQSSAYRAQTEDLWSATNPRGLISGGIWTDRSRASGRPTRSWLIACDAPYTRVLCQNSVEAGYRYSTMQ